VEFEEVIGALAVEQGTTGDAQLLSRDGSGAPVVHLSGLLTVDDPDGGDPGDAPPPVTLRLGDAVIWLWRDRFIEGHALGPRGAIEITTEDVILLIGPDTVPWVD
jgi:hypothetical protein